MCYLSSGGVQNGMFLKITCPPVQPWQLHMPSYEGLVLVLSVTEPRSRLSTPLSVTGLLVGHVDERTSLFQDLKCRLDFDKDLIKKYKEVEALTDLRSERSELVEELLWAKVCRIDFVPARLIMSKSKSELRL